MRVNSLICAYTAGYLLLCVLIPTNEVPNREAKQKQKKDCDIRLLCKGDLVKSFFVAATAVFCSKCWISTTLQRSRSTYSANDQHTQGVRYRKLPLTAAMFSKYYYM